VFAFVREPSNLPAWAHAFVAADERRARLSTPAGAVEVALRVDADRGTRTVDWHMTFPDGTIGVAQSRITETTRGTSIYSFVLHAPPVPLERLEGALEDQRVTLASELTTLKALLEA
jgi:hypothetical protein